MSATISRQQVMHLASLAKLDLSEDEIESYRRELTAIVEFIDQLQAADVGQLPPTEQVTGLKDVVRADTVQPGLGLSLEDLVQNTEMKARQFKVPKVNL